MSYKALYRTYRPSAFDSVAGQQHIVKTLKNALNEKKIAHAYLFCGPRGTGKTTMARIFAKALNCEEGFGNQCNECENCKAITEGRHPDVIEIDAASNRGIDDIRDLISKVKYAPILGQYKVYIIDEVHMMTTEAFNALLKTLEEPPANVVFILATTEPYKLMPTILSRCQRYDFSKVGDGDIYNRLLEICVNEGVEANDDALTAIVSLADGGMRDALSMLDQAIAYCQNNITLEAINELYGLSSLQEKITLLQYADKGDILNLTNTINTYLNNGIDIKRLTNDLIDVLKDVLIYNTAKDESLLKVLKASNVEILSLPLNKVNAWIDILLQVIMQYRLVNNIKSLFEISMLKLASYSSPVKEEVKIVEKVVIKEVEVPVTNTAAVNETQQVKENKKEEVVETKEETKEEVVSSIPLNFTNSNFANVASFSEEGHTISFTTDELINIMVQATKEARNKLTEKWPLLDRLTSNSKVGKYATTLKSTQPRIVCKNAVVFESSFKSVATKINLKENQIGFNKVIEALVGEDCLILCVTRQEYVAAVTKFNNLRQANKLPSPEEINIDTTLSNKKESISSTEELANLLSK